VLTALGTPTNTPIAENLFYLFTFSVNLQLIFAYLNRGVVELYWSVCIEEQFYLFAPWLVKNGKRFAWISVALITIGIVSKFVLHYLISSGLIELKNEEINPLYVFTTCWFDAFGLGILAAYVYFNKDVYARVQTFVENKVLQAIAILLAVLYVTNALPRPQFITDFFFSTVAAILFAYIVLAASTGNFILKLENNFLKSMGKYSYSMYVLHATVIQIFLMVSLRYVDHSNVLFYEVVYPLASILVVIAISALSYELFEKQFLKFKKNYTVVQNKKI
jgi:peptidoglycan/LPS O-acetylase OafA/YrhL